jgi:integrase
MWSAARLGCGICTLGDVTAFMIAESWRLAPETVQRAAVTGGRAAVAAAFLAPAGPDRRAAGSGGVQGREPAARLPQPLEPAQVAALLASCDRDTGAGRRDLTILTLFARMDLRAGEAAADTSGQHRLAAWRDQHHREGKPP